MIEERQLHRKLGDIMTTSKELSKTLTTGSLRLRWNQVEELLKNSFPRHYEQLRCEPDEDGCVPIAGISGNFLSFWLRAQDIEGANVSGDFETTPPTHLENLKNRSLEAILEASKVNIWKLCKIERQTLAQYWARLLRDESTDNLLALNEDFSKLTVQLNELQDDYRARVIEEVDIIGLTTTGLAQCAALLKRINFKVLICEEAGEVLEV